MVKYLKIKINKLQLCFGIIFVMIGIVSPFLINVANFKIYDTLYLSIDNSDHAALIVAAFKLVILNSLRALPNYLSVFLIAESVEMKVKGISRKWISASLGLIIIPLTYALIGYIYKVKYHLGVPVVILLLSILLIEKIDFITIHISKKSLIVILLLLGVQWLDIIPIFSQYGFGSGEMSMEVKRVASFINGNESLTLAALVFFSIFVSNALLLYKILKDQNEIMVAAQENERVEKELAEMRISSLEARTFQEIQSLVHDLKTPLTSIQALVSLSEMMVEDKKVKNYMNKISGSVDILSGMISEILYENKRNPISTKKIFEQISSQLSTYRLIDKVKFENKCPDKLLLVNNIRFSRAIINTLDNSFDAIDDETGEITLTVSSNSPYVIIKIEDNGKGIKNTDMNKVWERGFSTKSSSGIGLQFVKNIINSHDGTIRIISRYDVGTTITITLPEVILDEY